VHTLSHLRPLVGLGWVLLLVGGGVFLGSILAAEWRIYRQYSRAMRGAAGLYLSTLLQMSVKRFLFLVAAVVGVFLVVRGR
jgi:hypothetical protein